MGIRSSRKHDPGSLVTNCCRQAIRFGIEGPGNHPVRSYERQGELGMSGEREGSNGSPAASAKASQLSSSPAPIRIVAEDGAGNASMDATALIDDLRDGKVGSDAHQGVRVILG